MSYLNVKQSHILSKIIYINFILSHKLLFVYIYSEPEFRIGAALSDHSCIIYSVGESLNRTIMLDHNQSPIVGIKFSPISKNVLYIATNDGLITACDLRAKGKVVAEFKGNCRL